MREAATPRAVGRTARTVAALVCHDHVDMAVDCLGSLLRLCVDPLTVRVHDDGTLTDADVAGLSEALEGAQVTRRSSADEQMGDVLAGSPSARRLRERFPLALKLFDAPLLCKQRTFAFCDSDVLFLRAVHDPYALADDGARAVFMQDRESCYSLRSWQKLLSPRVRLPACANTGLIAFDTDAYDLEYLEWFVRRGLHRGIPSMLEQTAWAALGARVGCAVYDPRQARVMREGEDSAELVAGHFTARTRHLLPQFAERSLAAGPGDEAVRMRLVSPGRCSATTLASFELRRLGRRLVGRRG